MPYRRKNYNSKSKFKAKGINTKSLDTQQTQAIAKLQHAVKLIKREKPEVKISDSTLLNYVVLYATGTPGATTYISATLPDPSLTQGLAWNNNRIGAQLDIRKLEVSGFFKLDQNGVGITATDVRIMLVRFPRSIAFGLSTVLSDVSQQMGVLSPINSVYKNEFQVLYDKTLILNPYGNESKSFKIVKYGKNWNVNYVGNGTTIDSGEIRLFIFTNRTGANGPIGNVFIRTYYTDN